MLSGHDTHLAPPSLTCHALSSLGMPLSLQEGSSHTQSLRPSPASSRALSAAACRVRTCCVLSRWCPYASAAGGKGHDAWAQL
jgi:hypothetical protein